MENVAGNLLPPDTDLQLQLRDGAGTILACERLDGSAFMTGRRRRLTILPPAGSSAVRKLVLTPSADGDRVAVHASLVLPPGSPRPTEILLALRPVGGASARCGVATVR
jgi:hypothetical protein